MLFCLENLIKLKESSNYIQMISVSVKWTKDIDEFLNKLFVKWQYIFGSHLEAARYRRISFNIVKVMDDKLEKISSKISYYFYFFCLALYLILSNYFYFIS